MRPSPSSGPARGWGLSHLGRRGALQTRCGSRRGLSSSRWTGQNLPEETSEGGSGRTVALETSLGGNGARARFPTPASRVSSRGSPRARGESAPGGWGSPRAGAGHCPLSSRAGVGGRWRARRRTGREFNAATSWASFTDSFLNALFHFECLI